MRTDNTDGCMVVFVVLIIVGLCIGLIPDWGHVSEKRDIKQEVKAFVATIDAPPDTIGYTRGKGIPVDLQRKHYVDFQSYDECTGVPTFAVTWGYKGRFTAAGKAYLKYDVEEETSHLNMWSYSSNGTAYVDAETYSFDRTYNVYTLAEFREHADDMYWSVPDKCD